MIGELKKDVESALNCLPDHYRLAVILSDIEGFSYKEISDIMECPTGTVMSRLSRARHQLCCRLMKYQEKTQNADDHQNRRT